MPSIDSYLRHAKVCDIRSAAVSINFENEMHEIFPRI